MDYSYNYRFLAEFREANHLSKKDLLEALGSSDYTGINRWLEGKTPIHLTAMLRLCNYYNIPMSGFFFDGDGESHLCIMPPSPDSQTTPTDNYGIGNAAGKTIIETHIQERQISSSRQAEMVEEGLAKKADYYSVRPAPVQPEKTTDEQTEKVKAPAIPESEAVLRLKLEHVNELRQLERDNNERMDRIRRDCQATFDAERNRLMDIIERQNAELAKFYSRDISDNK